MKKTLIEKGHPLEVYLEEDGLRPEDVVLSGVIGQVNLGDVFEFIVMTRKSGVLYFFNEEGLLRRFYFENGGLIFTTSHKRGERLGEVLVKGGLITQEDLKEAEKHIRPGVKLGAVLVNKGIISPRELFEGVKAQIRTIMSGALKEKSGHFYFAVGKPEQQNIVHFSINTRALIMECMRLADERKYLKKLLENKKVLIDEKALKDLPPVHIRVVTLINQGLSVEEAAEIVGMGVDDVLDMLSNLRKNNLLQLLDRREQDSSEEKKTEKMEKIKAFLVDVNASLMDAFSVLASRVGEEEAISRLNSFFEDLPQELSMVLEGVSFSPDGSLNLEKILDNLKKLPQEEREEQTKFAMRELFNFVLFELLNAAGREATEPFENMMKLLERAHG